MDKFYQALGQYIVYRNALILNGIQSPVFLSVPAPTFQNHFTQPLIQAIRRDIQLNVVVVDLDKEEVIQWIL